MNPYTRRLLKQLTADKKKLSLMLILVMVGLLLWGRVLLKKVPRSAVANPNLAAQIENNGSGNTTNQTARPVVNVNMYRTLTRDMFLIAPEHYELVNPQVQESPQAKSAQEQPDDNQRVIEVTGQARKLRLMSTLLGQPPRAMINGELIRLGQQIQGFTLREVNSHDVSVEKNGIVIKLEL